MNVIQTDQAPQAVGPYSQAMEANGFVYTSGQLPLQVDGTLVTGAIEAQTHQVFENIKAVLGAVSLGLEDVVKVTIFITNMDDFKNINAIYGEYFSDHKPARSCVEVSKLPLGAPIEIEVIARVR